MDALSRPELLQTASVLCAALLDVEALAERKAQLADADEAALRSEVKARLLEAQPKLGMHSLAKLIASVSVRLVVFAVLTESDTAARQDLQHLGSERGPIFFLNDFSAHADGERRGLDRIGG